jgi:hypothetical protein
LHLTTFRHSKSSTKFLTISVIRKVRQNF